MNKTLTVLAFFLSILFNANGQTTFQTTIDLGGSDNACDIKLTSDGGYIISGMEFNLTTSAVQIFLLKLDANGNSQWSKFYSGGVANGANLYQNYRLLVTEQDEYVVVGAYGSSSSTADVLVMKTDAQGNLIWSNTYGGQGSDGGNSIFEDADGNYIIGGSFLLNSQRRMGYLKIAPNGNLLQQHFYADGLACPFFEAVPLDSGRIGIVHSYSSLLNVVDTSGNLLSNFPGVFSNGYSVDATQEPNGFAVLGLKAGAIGGVFAYVELNAAGTAVTHALSYALGSDDLGPRNLVRLSNGDHLVYGLTTSMSGPSALLAIRFDTNYNIIFANKYAMGPSAHHEACRALATPDGGWVFLGQHDRTGQYSDYDVYVVKTDAAGQSGCNQQAITLTTATPATVNLAPTSVYTASLTNGGTSVTPTVSIPSVITPLVPCIATAVSDLDRGKSIAFPNPVKDMLWVNGPENEYSWTLTNLCGKLIKSGRGSGAIKVDFSDVAPAVYTLQIIDGNSGATDYRIVRIQ